MQFEGDSFNRETAETCNILYGENCRISVEEVANRLSIGIGRYKSNMLKWIYSDADTMYVSGKKTHTMDHLLKCHMLYQECTTKDLMDYNEAAKLCVVQWINNV